MKKAFEVKKTFFQVSQMLSFRSSNQTKKMYKHNRLNGQDATKRSIYQSSPLDACDRSRARQHTRHWLDACKK